jgi:hypothetical protein
MICSSDADRNQFPESSCHSQANRTNDDLLCERIYDPHASLPNDFSLVVSQPFDHFRIGARLGCFAQHIGIDEVAHNISVDSDSSGTKKPFSGQERSHSTKPSFLGGSSICGFENF